MRTLDEVKGRCRIDDDGCWIWAGAVGCSMPRIYAPTHDGRMATHCGRKAVWQIEHPGERLPAGHLVFGTCGKDMCVNPACSRVGPKRLQGRLIARKGWLKGNARTAIAAREVGRRRSVLTAEMVAEIQASDETGLALAARLNVSHQTISKARRGELVCFQPVGGLFSGLMQGARA